MKGNAVGAVQANRGHAAENKRIAKERFGGGVVLRFMRDENEVGREMFREMIVDRFRAEGIDRGPDAHGRCQVNESVAVPVDVHPVRHRDGRYGLPRRRVGQVRRIDRKSAGRIADRGGEADKKEEQGRIKSHPASLAERCGVQ